MTCWSVSEVETPYGSYLVYQDEHGNQEFDDEDYGRAWLRRIAREHQERMMIKFYESK